MDSIIILNVNLRTLSNYLKSNNKNKHCENEQETAELYN